MYITSSGMVCSIGLTAEASCAAQRAGISGFTELDVTYNTEPIMGAVVPNLDTCHRPGRRLVELLKQPLQEVLQQQPSVRWESVPLLAGFAEPERPCRIAALAPDIVQLALKELKVKFHPTLSRVFTTGHTACFEGLREARELFKQGVTRCLVTGVDSLVNTPSLLWLDRSFRLKTPANHDGVIPGEAAGVVMLEANPVADTSAEVAGLGFAREKAGILSDQPLLGLGLTEATRNALSEARLGLAEIDGRLSDVTGETYGFKELPLVESRLMRFVRKQEQPLWHWADSIGDTGAAAGVAQLILAQQSLKKNYSPGDNWICWTSAMGGNRACAIVRRRSPPRT